MSEAERIIIGMRDKEVALLTKYGNRHGLIAGATGTGKTVTLQTIAEGFPARGAPVLWPTSRRTFPVSFRREEAIKRSMRDWKSSASTITASALTRWSFG